MTQPNSPGDASHAQYEHGKSLRGKVQRAAHGSWKLSKTRNPVRLLLEANRDRIPALLALKFRKMSDDVFGFFRGSAPLMASDLASAPVTGITAQICGDAHIRNMGAFAAADGRLMFDLNDFDESIEGPWEWDVKRFAASIEVAAIWAELREQDSRIATLRFLQSYRETLHALRHMSDLELSRYEISREKGTFVEGLLRKAAQVKPAEFFEDLVEKKHAGPVFRTKKNAVIELSAQDKKKVFAGLSGYRESLRQDQRERLEHYKPRDAVLRVKGTGSIGLRTYALLLIDDSAGSRAANPPLFLQVKQEPLSCCAPYLPHAPQYRHQGLRVAEAQFRLQAVPDRSLGWTTIDGRDFVVRELSEQKAGIEQSDLKPGPLNEYSACCGEVLARAHARSGVASAIAGYCGTSEKFDRGLADFARQYARQTVADHQAFVKSSQVQLIMERRTSDNSKNKKAGRSTS